MRAHEAIAERLFYLGGTPTTKPTEIVVGKTLKEMIQRDIKDEENAVNLYKEIIAKARKEKANTAAHLFEEILEDEEEHNDLFTTLAEET